MDLLSIEKLIELTAYLGQDFRFQRALSFFKKKWNSNLPCITNHSAQSIVSLAKKINQKYMETAIFSQLKDWESVEAANSWCANEYKIFGWVSVCYIYTHNIQNISGLSLHQNSTLVELLRNIFSLKAPIFLEYHLRLLQRTQMNRKEVWPQVQEDILVSIIQQERFQNKWSDISLQLFRRSRAVFHRSPQKCREQWFNHLNPKLSREKWTLEEDLQLIELIDNCGSKWAQISKSLNGIRTEHMIKNRYNCLIRKNKKKLHGHSSKNLLTRLKKALKNQLIQREEAKWEEEEEDLKQNIMKTESIMKEEKRDESESKEQTEAVQDVQELAINLSPAMYFEPNILKDMTEMEEDFNGSLEEDYLYQLLN